MTSVLRRLTVKEVAEIEGVDEKTVRGWITRKELRAHDASRGRGRKPRWRIAPADLELFEAARANTLGVTPKPERRRKVARPEGFIEYV